MLGSEAGHPQVVDVLWEEGHQMEAGVGVLDGEDAGSVLTNRGDKGVATAQVDGTHAPEVTGKGPLPEEVGEHELVEQRSAW